MIIEIPIQIINLFVKLQWHLYKKRVKIKMLKSKGISGISAYHMLHKKKTAFSTFG